MIFGWNYKKATCKSCKKETEFRYGGKQGEFKNHNGWNKIHSGGEIVLCPNCGDTIWIPNIVLEEIKLPPRKKV